MPNPMSTDLNGRLPLFYLADGQIHLRLTDPLGVVIFDELYMMVLGPSSSGGGGGVSVDPTTIASTGDCKWRPTGEVLAGWVKADGSSVGSPISGATQRANADTQNLYLWLWQNFPQSKCPVVGGRGSNALSDFQSNAPIGVFDMRGRAAVGCDGMSNINAGRLTRSNITSGGGDGVNTPSATGGEANHLLLVSEAPPGQYTYSDPGHLHHQVIPGAQSAIGAAGGGLPAVAFTATPPDTKSATTGITLIDNAGGQIHNNMPPFMLGSWFVKL